MWDILRCFHGVELLVSINFNAKFAAMEGSRCGEDIVAAILKVGLDDLSAHFLLHHKFWAQGGSTWIMRRCGRDLLSQTDYLMVKSVRSARDLS